MRVIHLARKPLGEPTVATNVLAHGTGALHISATRVGYQSEADMTPSVGKKEPGLLNPGCGPSFPHHKENWGAWRVNTAGRWPANVILEHRPECRQVGIVKVPGTGIRGAVTVTRETDVRWKPHTNPKSKVPVGRTQPVWGYTDPDGTETVMAWECGPGCPVAALDLQSGERPVSGAARTGRPARGGKGTGVVQFGVEEGNGALHNDSGGASRFFKQIGGKKS